MINIISLFKKRRFFVLLICVLGLSILFFYRPKGADETVSTGIRIAIQGNPTNMDPRYATDAYSSRIIPLVFSALVRLDETSKVVLDLAEGFRMSDARTYEFTLKRGVYFQNGKELTAYDVQYTFDYIRNPKNACPSQSSFALLDRIEIIDKYRLRFHLKEIFPSFLFKLTKGIVSKETDSKTKGKFIGTGPYVLSEWKPGEYILLKKNTSYYTGSPKLDWIKFIVLPNTSTRLLKMKKGEVDLLQNSVPPYAVKFFKEMKNVTLFVKDGVNFKYLGYNLRHSVLKNALVRKAISYAVNRDTIIKYTLKGYATPAKGILSPLNWAHEGNVKTYGYDPQLARTLLDLAGFMDKDGPGPIPRFKLSFKTSTDKESIEIANIIKQQLHDVGIEIEIRSYEWGTFFSDIKKGNFDMYSLRWVGITDPDILYYIFHSSNMPPAGANRGCYSNRKVDSLLEKSRTILDPDKRKNVYSKIQKILAEDIPYTSLWYVKNIVVIRNCFQGFKIYPGGEYTSLKDVIFRRDNKC